MSAATKAARRAQLPPRTIIGQSTDDQAPITDDQPIRVASIELEDSDGRTAAIFLPIGEEPAVGSDQPYRRRFHNIDCRLTDKGHVEGFQRLYYALNQRDTRLASGKHVETPSDVIKFLVEQYTASLSGS